MIRKLTMFTFIMMVAFALAACGGNKSNSKGNDQKTVQSGKGSQSTKNSPSGKQAAPKIKGLVSKNKTVAVVNGKKIKGSQYNSVLQSLETQYRQQGQDPTSGKVFEQVKKQAISSVVGKELVLQDANKKGYQPSDKKVSQQLDQAEKRFGGKKKFEKLLKQQNMTIDQYKKKLKMNLELNAYINKEAPVKVTDKEIKAAYQQYKSNTKKPQKLQSIKPAIKSQLKQQKQGPKIAEIISQLKKKGKVSIKI